MKVNFIKMKYNEDVNIYSNQVEELYFKLYNANVINKSETNKNYLRP